VTVFGHAETDSGPDRSLVALVAGKKVLEERSDSLEEAAIGVVRIVVVRAVVVTRAVVGLVTIGLRFAVTATVVAVIGRRIVVAPVLTRSRFRIVDGLFVRVVTVLGFPRVVFGFVIFGLVTLGRVPVISLVALGLVAIVRLVIDSFVAIVRLVIVGLVAFVGLVPTAGPSSRPSVPPSSVESSADSPSSRSPLSSSESSAPVSSLSASCPQRFRFAVGLGRFASLAHEQLRADGRDGQPECREDDHGRHEDGPDRRRVGLTCHRLCSARETVLLSAAIGSADRSHGSRPLARRSSARLIAVGDERR